MIHKQVTTSKKRTYSPPDAISWAMGCLSLFACIGFIAWGVELTQRDPSQLPAIRAPEGEARRLPKELGQRAVKFQELQINQIGASNGIDGNQPIVLAPAPEELPDDVTPARVNETFFQADPQPIQFTSVNDDTAARDEVHKFVLTENQGDLSNIARIQSPNTAISDTNPTLTSLNGEVQSDNLTSSLSQSKAISDSLNKTDTRLALQSSSIPQLRPSALKRNPPSKQENASQNSSPSFKNGRIETAPKDAKIVQLGAYETEEMAISMWTIFKNRHRELLKDRSYYIEKTVKNSKTYYRLRTFGFKERAEARSFCKTVAALQTPCIAIR